MSSKRISPTSSLLRASRLFSIPPPIPRTDVSLSGFAGRERTSDTATAAHPTLQALATPASSQARGDWGLKRSLPSRLTAKTSTPTVRIKAIDTREHITDYESAADLTVTLEKFKELGMPVTVEDRTHTHALKRRGHARSAFEADLDNTDEAAVESAVERQGDLEVDPVTGQPTSSNPKFPVKRWKYRGPWLAGMSENDFLAFANKELRERKQEFIRFARQRIAEQERADARHKARADGSSSSIEASADSSAPESNVEPSEEQFTDFMLKLRGEFAASHVNSDLGRLIGDFLDLPGLSSSRRTNEASQNIYNAASAMATGPPGTHPSAGLGYLRTDAVLFNHPIYGPLANQPPRIARVLSGANPGLGQYGRIGVAGLVTNEPGEKGARVTAYPRDSGDMRREDKTGRTIGVTVPGGARIWVEPLRVEIDERGRVQMTIENADPKAVGALTGEFRGPSYEQSPRSKPFRTLQPAKGLNDPEVANLPGGKAKQNTYGISDTETEKNDAELYKRIIEGVAASQPAKK